MTGVKCVEPQLVAALVLEHDRGSRGLNPTVRIARRGTMTNGEEVRQGEGQGGAKAEARDQVMKEFEEMVERADRLRQSTSELASEEYGELRDQLSDALKRVRGSLDRTEWGMMDQGAAASQSADEHPREPPWCTIAAASGVGFLLGLLARR